MIHPPVAPLTVFVVRLLSIADMFMDNTVPVTLAVTLLPAGSLIPEATDRLPGGKSDTKYFPDTITTNVSTGAATMDTSIPSPPTAPIVSSVVAPTTATSRVATVCASLPRRWFFAIVMLLTHSSSQIVGSLERHGSLPIGSPGSIGLEKPVGPLYHHLPGIAIVVGEKLHLEADSETNDSHWPMRV